MLTPLTKPSVLRGVELLQDPGDGTHVAISRWRGYIGVTPVDYQSTTVLGAGQLYSDGTNDVIPDRDTALAALGYSDS